MQFENFMVPRIEQLEAFSCQYLEIYCISFFSNFNCTRSFDLLPFASVVVEHISGSQPAEVHNLGKSSLSHII